MNQEPSFQEKLHSAANRYATSPIDGFADYIRKYDAFIKGVEWMMKQQAMYPKK